MVGAPNARTRVDNQQRAELDGSEGTDTHVAILSGSPGDDTRSVTLAGEVTDTHMAQLNGTSVLTPMLDTESIIAPYPGITLNANVTVLETELNALQNEWISIRSYNVNSLGSGNDLLIVFATSMIYSRFGNGTTNWESRVVRNGTTIFPTQPFVLTQQANIHQIGIGLFSFFDRSPPEGSNTYNLQVRCTTTSTFIYEIPDALYSVPIAATEDTHAVTLTGVTGIDTHDAVLEGTAGNSLEPKLLGDSGVDTHQVVFTGNGPSIQTGNIETIELSAPTPSQPRRATNANTSESVPVASTTVIANNLTGEIGIAYNIFMTTFIRSENIINWRLQRSDGLILSSGTEHLSGTTQGRSDFVIDRNPMIGENTYQLFCWGPNFTYFHGCVLNAYFYDINDTHSPELIGEKTDSHALQISGSITPDTHTVTLQGSPPVDTHSANLIGNVRGKSPIGGRLR